MKKKILIISIITVLILIGITLFLVLNKENKFKTEYEVLNGQKNSNNKEYKKVIIPKSNKVKYVNVDEVLKLLDKGTGVLYFGFAECPWCRSMVEELVKVVNASEIKNLYYFNDFSIRDLQELDENGEVNITEKGTEEYYKILEILNPYLTPYTGLDDESIKRLYTPIVVFLEEGNVKAVHIGTLEEQKDPYENLTKTQIEKLNKTLTTYISRIKETSCNTQDFC